MVNSSIYIFGNFDGGYTQYPDNYAKNIYQKYFVQSPSKSQIIIHRENDLMYYGYVRKLDNNSQYIGFCVLLNGSMFSNISILFSIFENTITELISRGDIISFNDKGEIVSRTNILSDKQQEIVMVSASIKDAIDHRLKDYTTALPPVNNAIASTEKKYFDIKDSHDIIVASSCENGFIYVSKNTGCNTPTLSSYKGVIRKLHKEKDELADKYAKLKKQKKQSRNIIALCVVLIMCGVGIFFLCGRLSTEKGRCESVENELDSLINDYKETQPFIIKSASFDLRRRMLYFDYYGYCTKTIKLEVMAISPNCLGSHIEDFTIKKGRNYSSIYMGEDLNNLKRWCTFVFLIDNKIIGGARIVRSQQNSQWLFVDDKIKDGAR